MPLYRIYAECIGNRAAKPEDVECASDVEALAEALAQLHPGCWAEVWAGTRCLGRVVQPAPALQHADTSATLFGKSASAPPSSGSQE